MEVVNKKIQCMQCWGRFHKLFCTLRPTFEKLFRGVECTLRRAPNFYEIDPRLSPSVRAGPDRQKKLVLFLLVALDAKTIEFDAIWISQPVANDFQRFFASPFNPSNFKCRNVIFACAGLVLGVFF